MGKNLLMAMEKDISGCSVFGMLDRKGDRFSGRPVADGLSVMRERTNGLGAGYAGYGIYPDFPGHYALHIFYHGDTAREETEAYLKTFLRIDLAEPMAVKDKALGCPGRCWRYFCRFRKNPDSVGSEADRVVAGVTEINLKISGAFVFSSGKNMGVFKGVGWPEEIAEFFRLDDYRGFLWLGHGRFPTNTSGSWAGAHPFNLLEWSVVHNGEVSSYGANRRYVEGFGYRCSVSTDSEVITYLVDLLARRHGLSFPELAAVMAAPLWAEIDRYPARKRDHYRNLRITYGPALLNGPFSIIVGFDGGMFGLGDRIKLRPLVAGESAKHFYLSSEEAAVRKLEASVSVRHPEGGEPVLYRVERKARP